MRTGTRPATAWGLLLVVSCAITSCHQSTSQTSLSEEARADALWLPHQATVYQDDVFQRNAESVRNGRSVYRDNRAAVMFSFDAGCAESAKILTSHFDGTEWKRRRTEYLNPQSSTSFEAGCQERRGGGVIFPQNPSYPVHSDIPDSYWTGEWDGRRGDILRYSISGTKVWTHGYAEYVPRQVVDAAPKRSDGR